MPAQLTEIGLLKNARFAIGEIKIIGNYLPYSR